MKLLDELQSIRKGLQKPLVLVGTGGAGKTSLGKLLSEKLMLEFVDSDDVIVKTDGRSIPEIFSRSGEGYFRDLERQVLLKLSQDKTINIIGTGGGAFMNEETRGVILKNTLSIFIKADLAVLSQRVGSGEGRPLFQGKNVEEVLKNLIEERYPVYEQADLTVSTYDETEKETLNRLISTLYMHLKPE